MRPLPLLALVPCLFSVCFAADLPQWSADEAAIAQADRDFYQASLARGGAAWGEFASNEARLPGASGKQEIRSLFEKVYANPGFQLSWHPEFAKVFGDVGVTSGPFVRHLRDKDGKDQISTGTYVTVWRREADGSWRFQWDGGTDAK